MGCSSGSGIWELTLELFRVCELMVDKIWWGCSSGSGIRELTPELFRVCVLMVNKIWWGCSSGSGIRELTLELFRVCVLKVNKIWWGCLRGRLHSAFLMCVSMFDKPFVVEAWPPMSHASASNGLSDIETHIENAPCNRPLRGSGMWELTLLR
jgi:hypothetical protein